MKPLIASLSIMAVVSALATVIFFKKKHKKYVVFTLEDGKYVVRN